MMVTILMICVTILMERGSKTMMSLLLHLNLTQEMEAKIRMKTLQMAYKPTTLPQQQIQFRLESMRPKMKKQRK